MKELPFDLTYIRQIVSTYPTPFYLYDEQGIRKNIKNLNEAFSILPGFKEYFAVKALPNPTIMQVLHEEWCGLDCSSPAELALAEHIGVWGDDIIFSSNDTPLERYEKAQALGAIINIDDISAIEILDQLDMFPSQVCCRYNPGAIRQGNSIMGDPVEAKYGMTKDQIFQSLKILQGRGVNRFGLHTMIISNELNPNYFIDTAKLMFDLVLEVYTVLGITIDFVDLGGGLGIPYHPEDQAIEYSTIAQGMYAHYQNIILVNRLSPLNIFLECGRIITGPYGYLVTKAITRKSTYKEYIGVDASMANLMRPGMYGAYHHISVLGKQNDILDHIYDIVWPLCENNDKFAINRNLPEIVIGDFLVMHDVWAHGHAMGFNYNGMLRSAELLLQENGTLRLIRRAETIEDYFATLVYT